MHTTQRQRCLGGDLERSKGAAAISEPKDLKQGSVYATRFK
jgi:hypothetical protein